MSLSQARATRDAVIAAAADGAPLDTVALAAADRALAEAHARAEVEAVSAARATRRAHAAEVLAMHSEAAEHDAGITAAAAETVRAGAEADAALAAAVAAARRFGDAAGDLRARHHAAIGFNWQVRNEAIKRNPVLAEIRAGANPGEAPVSRRARPLGAFVVPEVATIDSAGPDIAKDSRSFEGIARAMI